MIPNHIYMESDWMGMNWHHKGPFFDISEDSLTLNTVRVNVVKSKDSCLASAASKTQPGKYNGRSRTYSIRNQFPG